MTVDGETRELPTPFFLLATENPIEYEGTFPLPEAQLDRFLLRTALGYPGVREERRILEEQRYGHPLGDLRARRERSRRSASSATAAQHVYVDDAAAQLDRRPRPRDARARRSSRSAAPSAAASPLERVARAWALLNGRDYVVPEDVERLFVPVLVHRDRLHARARRPRRGAAGWRRRDRGVPPGVPRARAPPRLRRGSALHERRRRGACAAAARPSSSSRAAA